MEDKIEIGEYIRANDGTIGKIIADKEEPLRYVIDDCGQIVLHTDIVKHSKNIIKLIDIDDYVNGLAVIGKYLDENGKVCLILDTTDEIRIRCYNENIKTVITKELYKSVEYEVK